MANYSYLADGTRTSAIGSGGSGLVRRGSLTYRTGANSSLEFEGADFGARHYSPALTRWLTPDPLSEKYYGRSPYAYCNGDPVNLVDPDGKTVRAMDRQSKMNIRNTLSKQERRYVRFNMFGRIRNRVLQKSPSNSNNMTALKQLSDSKTRYLFYTANEYEADGAITKLSFSSTDNYTKGVTLMPGAEKDTSPDNSVHIYTCSDMSDKDQALNTAHEAYGHALLYDRKQNGEDVNPNHMYENVAGEPVWAEECDSFVYTSVRIDTNTLLLELINKAEDEVKKHFLEN